jgi:hypothetical protein
MQFSPVRRRWTNVDDIDMFYREAGPTDAAVGCSMPKLDI